MKMNAATLKALKGSIKKWKGIVAGKAADRGTDDCALCAKFYNRSTCDGCPVAARTTLNFCINTPYQQWARNHRIGNLRYADTPKREELAQAELDFLISLLPKKKAAAKKRRATHTARKRRTP